MPLKTRMWGAGKLLLLGGALFLTYVLFAAAAMRVALKTREVVVPSLPGRTVNEATALLAHQGLRPTAAGGHLAVVEAMNAQFPGVVGLKSIDRLRRRRNQAEYPDPQTYDPVSPDEVHDAIEAATGCVDAAEKLTAAPQLGVF